MLESVSIFQRYAEYINPFKVDSLRSIEFDRLFIEAKGCYLFDENGNAYLDLVAGFGSNTLGHCHSQLLNKMTETLMLAKPNINPWGIAPEAAKLAEKLVLCSKNKLNKVYFASSGAEAIDSALKFAMAHTQRISFIAVRNGFHGLTLATTSLSDNVLWHNGLPSFTLDVDYININDLEELTNYLKRKPVAAIILEPIQGSSAAGAWDGEILNELANLAKRYGTLLIIDEVMTGLGRTGDWFAYQTLCPDLNPDIVVTSKGLTGGLIPLSAVLMTDEIYHAMFSDSLGANHAATFSGNHLAMSCGLAVLEITERETLLTNARVCGDLFKEALHQLASRQLPIRNINVTGLCITFTIAEDECYPLSATDICLNLLREGVLTALTPHHPDTIRLTPPLNISATEIQKFIAALTNCFHSYNYR